jgi:hypothetical protein
MLIVGNSNNYITLGNDSYIIISNKINIPLIKTAITIDKCAGILKGCNSDFCRNAYNNCINDSNNNQPEIF